MQRVSYMVVYVQKLFLLMSLETFKCTIQGLKHGEMDTIKIYLLITIVNQQMKTQQYKMTIEP